MESYARHILRLGWMMKVIVPLLTLFPFVYANKCNLIIQACRCPGNASQWEKRGHQFQCDATKNITYHCILNSKDRLHEGCLKKYVITRNEGGCPWILEKEGRLLSGVPFSLCPPNITGCPEMNHREYTSDSLYLYPKCLVPKNLRNNTPIPTQSLTHVTQIYTDATPTRITESLEKNSNEKDVSCASYIAAMIVFILTTIASAVYIVHKVYTYIKGRRNREKQPPEEGESLIESSKLSDGMKENKRAPSSSRADYLGCSDVDEHWHQKGPFIENKASTWLNRRLKELRGKKIRPLYLHGISGSGKSTVALHCLGEDIFIVKASKKHHLIKSLKELADSKSIRFDEDETKLKDTIIDISKQLKGKLLIDDVNDESTLELVYPLLQKVQCVVTTTNKNLVYDIDSSDHLEVKGLSVNEASELFKVKNLRVNHENDDFKQLISILEGSPSGILSVIKHMKEMKVTVNRVLRYIKQNEGHFDKENEGGKLFNSLGYLLEYMTSAHPEILGLVMALQFLSDENIPICLLYALAAYEAKGRLPEDSDIDFEKAESVVNTFISALQEVSFGEVTGVDDERKINVPTVVQITVMKSSQQPEDRRQLHLNLLKCMSWLFVKDHGDKSDHRRCMDLLPHATKMMHNFPLQGSETTIEESLVFIQVCDQVRYTYEVLGHEFKEKQYAECLMKHVLEKVLCKRKDYFKVMFQNEADNIETIANEILHNCKEITQKHEKTISNLAVDYIKNKVRSDNYQETLKGIVGENVLFTACRITSSGMKSLQGKHLLVKDHSLLARIFMYEVLITGLRTFCRYTLVHENNNQMFHSFARLIKSLAKHECDKEALENFKSIRSVGIEFMEMEAACTLSETSSLTSLIEQTEKLLSDDSKYFKYGLFVQIPRDNLNHILRCKCVMLQCYKRLKQPKELDECAKSIKALFDKNRATCMKASYSQKAKQEIVDFYMEKEKHKEAIDFLRKYKHMTTSKVTSKSDCIDIFLQCRCYQKLRLFEERSNYLHRFDFKVPTEETYAREIIEKIKETEQHV